MMFKNKKAQTGGPGYAWIYGLVMLFGIGILYVIFNQVFLAHLLPVLTQTATDTITDVALRQEVLANQNKFMTYWNFLPYVLFAVIVIYMIVRAFQKEGQSEY